MIATIARKELTEIGRDGRFLWSSLIIIVLLLVSLGVGAQRYSEDRQLRVAAALEDREGWLNQGAKGPHTAGHYGVYAFKPATPLALFDPGFNDYTGTVQYLEAHKENQASYKPAADATALQRFGNLSGAMVLQLLVPLLIILLCFGMVSGEREDGTLRQLMSLGVPYTQLIWGKALGVTGAIAVVLVPSILVGGIVATFLTRSSDAHDLIDLPMKLLTIGLVYVAFFAIFVFVALAVSIRSRTSAAALTTLVGFWIVTGLLIPRMAADVSKWAHPTPSAFEVAAAVEKGRDQGPHAHEPNHPNHIAFRENVLKKYGVRSIEELPVSFVGLALQADEELGFRVFDRTYGEVRRIYERQNRVHQLFSILSPVIAIKNLSAGLAGTDVAFANDFSAAGEAYRRHMVGVLNDDLIKNTRGMTSYSAEWGYRANKSLWEKVPVFDFDPPRLATILERNLFPLLILLLWLGASFAVLTISARRAKLDM
jgi:ABC-2 type transport system permease protein